jgi:hypothetical protein
MARDAAEVRTIDTVKSGPQWATTVSYADATTEVVPWDWSEARAHAEEAGLRLVRDEEGHMTWRRHEPDAERDSPAEGGSGS